MNSVPSPRDLQRHFTPTYCTHWREIGIDLGLSDVALDEIEADNPTSVRKCCTAMLAKWLSLDNEPTWKKMFCAIEVVPRVSHRPDKGNKKITLYIYIMLLLVVHDMYIS